MLQYHLQRRDAEQFKDVVVVSCLTLHRVSTACCTVLSTVVTAALVATFGLFSIYFVAYTIMKRDNDRELVFVLVGERKRVKPCLSLWLCFQMSVKSVHVVTMYCCVKTPSALIAVFCW